CVRAESAASSAANVNRRAVCATARLKVRDRSVCRPSWVARALVARWITERDEAIVVESAATTMRKLEYRLEFGASRTSSHQGSVSYSQAGRVRCVSLRIESLQLSSSSTSEIR